MTTREDIEAKLEAFDRALKALREGLTPEEIAQITFDMNIEYIEPFDDSIWSDNEHLEEDNYDTPRNS